MNSKKKLYLNPFDGLFDDYQSYQSKDDSEFYQTRI